jgi:hypothetical protein
MHETSISKAIRAAVEPGQRPGLAAKEPRPARPERPFLGFMALCDEILDVSPRKGADIIKQPWFPESISLGGPRTRKWNRQEVIEAITNRAPRLKVRPEPPQLAAARDRRTA